MFILKRVRTNCVMQIVDSRRLLTFRYSGVLVSYFCGTTRGIGAQREETAVAKIRQCIEGGKFLTLDVKRT